MDRKSQTLTVIFALIVTASVVATYQRYIVRGDIYFETDEETFQASLLEE